MQCDFSDLPHLPLPSHPFPLIDHPPPFPPTTISPSFSLIAVGGGGGDGGEIYKEANKKINNNYQEQRNKWRRTDSAH